MKKRLALSLSVLALTACATTPEADWSQLQGLTAFDFESRVVVVDDDLETRAVLSSEPAFVKRSGSFQVGFSDVYLRAEVDKRSLETRFEVVQWVLYDGDARDYSVATFASAEGAREAPLRILERAVVSCGRSGQCSRKETFAFTVEESILRNSAENGDWRFRVRGRNGAAWDGLLTTAEIRGFVARVDVYRASKRR